MKQFSKEEMDIIEKYYPKLGALKLSQGLLNNRSQESITGKANRMGVKYARNNVSDSDYIDKLIGLNIKSLEPYKGSKVAILHKCMVCDNIWKVEPVNLLRIKFSGCPICNKGFGYNLHKDNMPEKAYLYLLRITYSTGESFYKVGVTCRDVPVRVKELKGKISKSIDCTLEVLKVITNTGSVILNLEKKVLNSSVLSKHYTKYKFSGDTELLSIDNSIDNILKELMYEQPRFV